MYPRTDHSAPQHVRDAQLASLPDLHALHARNLARADAIAERVSRLVNSGLSDPDMSAVMRRPATRSHRSRRLLFRAA